MYDYGFGISNVDSLDYATPQLNVYLNLSNSRIDMLEEVSMIISVNKGFGKTSAILYWDDSVNFSMIISGNNEFGRRSFVRANRLLAKLYRIFLKPENIIEKESLSSVCTSSG